MSDSYSHSDNEKKDAPETPLDQDGKRKQDEANAMKTDKNKESQDITDESEGLSFDEQDLENIDDILDQYAKEGLTDEMIIETEEDIVDKDSIIARQNKDLEEKKHQLADYYSRYLRLKAEFDNYKKRMRKEKADIIQYSNEALILELLPILDNLERAIDSAKKSNDFESLVSGLEMVHKQEQDLLEKFGISTISAVGQKFDPRIHEAFMRVDVDEDQDKQVLAEIQKGYILHEKVIRPARVSVGFSAKRSDSGQPELEDKENNDTNMESNDLSNSEGT